jgi:hypothetical protein
VLDFNLILSIVALLWVLQRWNAACTIPAMRDAERHWLHSHAERGNDKTDYQLKARQCK